MVLYKLLFNQEAPLSIWGKKAEEKCKCTGNCAPPHPNPCDTPAKMELKDKI